MKSSNTKPRRQAKNLKKPAPKVLDLVPKKDARGGEDISFNYSKIHYGYKP